MTHDPARPAVRSRAVRQGALAAAVIVLAVVLGGVVYVVGDHGSPADTSAGRPAASTTSPGQSTAPPSLAGPTTAAAVLKGLSPQGSPLAERVRAALGGMLTDPALGATPGISVVDVASGDSLVNMDASSARIPASTTKLLTAAAALEVIGPDAHFSTRVVASAPGQIVLVGGGDPALSQRTSSDDDWPYAVTSLTDLAAKTATALRGQGVASVQVAYAADLFAGPSVSPEWPAGYISSGQVGPITALSLDGSRRTPGMAARVDDPPAYAAERFAALLSEAGIVTTVSGGVATPAGATELASVDSPSIADLVSQMLLRSDNDVAEILARQIALTAGQPASFGGIQAAITGALTAIDVPVRGVSLADGSGLARADQIAPETLVATLVAAADAQRPELRPLLTGLPVAGFTGTLAQRFADPAAPIGTGDIRAKTGYLSGVVALAGYVRDENDQLLVFAFVANGVPGDRTADAQKAVDDMAVRLAGCGCS